MTATDDPGVQPDALVTLAGNGAEPATYPEQMVAIYAVRYQEDPATFFANLMYGVMETNARLDAFQQVVDAVQELAADPSALLGNLPPGVRALLGM